MRSFRQLIERQIAKARATGGLSGLKGEGEPLPDRRVETETEAATSVGFRIMAEAGVLPEEFELKKQLDAARKTYAASLSKDGARKIADLEMRTNIAIEARRKFMK